MKKSLRAVTLIFCLVSSLGAVSDESRSYAFKKLDLQIPVRVLLKQRSLSTVSWTFKNEEGFLVYAPLLSESTIFEEPELTVTYKGGSLYVNQQRQAAKKLFFLPLKGFVEHGGVTYDGFFSVSHLNDVAYLVNHVELKDYLASVLRSECYITWPTEVKKAHCIAARSYAVSMVHEKRERHKNNRWPYPYDIKNTTFHQMYQGHKIKCCYKKIVDDTGGLILMHDSKPVLAMYNAVCGGIIPAQKKGVDFARAPYLKRDYPCTHCKEHSLYRWERTLTFKEIEKVLKKALPRLRAIQDIKITSADEAGIAQTISIKSMNRWHTISAGKFRRLFCETLPSICFTFTKKGRSLVVTGKGFGHHMGMCPWGAHHMAKNGHTHKDILSFYYPDTSLEKIAKLP